MASTGGTTTSAECPICHAVVQTATINSHIDRCLREENSSKFSPVIKKRQASLTPTSQAKIRKVDSQAQQDEHDRSGDPLKTSSNFTIPLAELVRPTCIEDFVGQKDVVGTSSSLYTALQSGDVPSLIFWGPPGCGKTTLARIIANRARASGKYRFVQLSATTSGIADVKEAIRVAKNQKSLSMKRTILFVDEIHRFNKLQQDTFLSHVENGTITLLGATTENPSFQVNSALLSRCKVVIFNKLQIDDVMILLERTLTKLDVEIVTTKESHEGVCILEGAVTALAELCDGDGRSALNGLQLAVQTKRKLAEETLDDSDAENKVVSLCISVDDIKGCLQKTHLLYDRAGDEHFHSISALHKSMRGGDENASLYWLSRMLCGGEDPLYIARRLIRCASEDVGLADPNALTQAVSAFNACQYIGMPECEVAVGNTRKIQAQDSPGHLLHRT